MKDARRANTVRSWISRLTLLQELIVLTGVILFFVGVAAAGTIPKLVAFLASGSAWAYVLVTLWRTDGAAAETADETESERKHRTAPHERTDAPRPASAVPAVRSVTPREYVFNLSDFCDPEEGFGKEAGPGSEFKYLLQKVLSVIKDVNFAHTVAFSWINRDKRQLVLEAHVTDSTLFTSHRRRELGLDLVSQVAASGKPRVLNSVNQGGQQEALGYYQNTEQVRSFAAVPVFYPGRNTDPLEPVAVLWLDTLAEDAFGPETVVLLGRFAKVLSALIQSYTGKYDLLLDSEVLRSIARLRDQMKMEFSPEGMSRSLAEETARLISWDHVAVVLFDEHRNAWIIRVVMNRGNDPYVSQGQEVDPHGSLVGEVIQTGIPKILESAASLEIPRFFAAERTDSKGSLVVLPVNSITRCYGALVVESRDARTYSEADVRTIQRLVDTVSTGLEIYALGDVVDNYVLLDETTGVANRRYFIERLHEEVQRAKDYDNEITVVMLSIDDADEQVTRYGKDGFDFILQNVGRLVKSFIRPYDLVGRFDFNRFAVLLISTSSNEAYLWAEKVRKNIASNVINIDQKSFSVTVSAGICGAVENRTDVELMENANHVLGKAIEAGGNMVRIY